MANRKFGVGTVPSGRTDAVPGRGARIPRPAPPTDLDVAAVEKDFLQLRPPPPDAGLHPCWRKPERFRGLPLGHSLELGELEGLIIGRRKSCNERPEALRELFLGGRVFGLENGDGVPARASVARAKAPRLR